MIVQEAEERERESASVVEREAARQREEKEAARQREESEREAARQREEADRLRLQREKQLVKNAAWSTPIEIRLWSGQERERALNELQKETAQVIGQAESASASSR